MLLPALNSTVNKKIVHVLQHYKVFSTSDVLAIITDQKRSNKKNWRRPNKNPTVPSETIKYFQDSFSIGI